MDIYSAQRLIGEDIITVMYERYTILKFVSENNSAGRRSIADALNLTERTARKHIDYLSDKNLIRINKYGVTVLDEAYVVLDYLADYFSRVFSFKEKEVALKELLDINDVVIVRGNCDTDEVSISNMAYEADKIFTDTPLGSKIIGVSGGRTMKAVADNLKSIISSQIVVVPVRGAVGRSHTASANSVSTTIGMKLKCNAYSLNVPENLSGDALKVFSQHPDVQVVTSTYDKIDMLFFGIGRPDELIEYRIFDELEKGLVSSDNCIGEALGYYLDINGKVILHPKSIGLSTDQIKRIPKKYAVAGGASKKDAIKAVCSFAKDIVLITDEGCADALLK